MSRNADEGMAHMPYPGLGMEDVEAWQDAVQSEDPDRPKRPIRPPND